tara:strand:- start:53 stop:454 length:402 start_codon:yes stop_codon:yes gene_type:complete
MMDYISYFPGPTKTSGVNDIVIAIQHIPRFVTISRQFVHKEVERQFNIVTRNDTYRGSAAGWGQHERPEIILKVKHQLNLFLLKKKRFKAIIKTLVYINKSYFDTLQSYYKPGNKGMTDAYLEFEHLKTHVQC